MPIPSIIMQRRSGTLTNRTSPVGGFDGYVGGTGIRVASMAGWSTGNDPDTSAEGTGSRSRIPAGRVACYPTSGHRPRA